MPDVTVANLRNLGLALHRASLTSVSPAATALYRWLMKPQVGDLVVEVTTRTFDPDAVGRVLEISWTEGDRPLVEYAVLETLDGGRSVRWENCELVRLPMQDDDLRAMFARESQHAIDRDGSA